MRARSALIPLLLVLATASGAYAQGGDPTWRGEYFNNTDLSGSPALVRDDPALNFAWGEGSPAPGVVNTDNFSVRWTRAYDTAPGKYKVVVWGDDGYRVRIDGATVVDRWFPQSPAPFGFEVDLAGGRHQVEVTYFERTGNAQFQGLLVPAQPTLAPVGSYVGQYFANANLAGSPAATRPDAGINFDWGIASPLPGVVPADNFSVRWTGTVGGPPGSYAFTTTTDDGLRLWVNNQLLIDRWYPQAATPHSATVYLPGPAPLRLEYFEGQGNAVAKLSWSRVGSTGGAAGGGPGSGTTGGGAGAPDRGNPNDVIVDNGGPGYEQGGDAGGWNSSSAGFSGSRWALNRFADSPGLQWARWFPTLAAGNYEVFVFVPNQNATTRQATYWLSHAGQFTSHVVNQNSFSNQWVSLGTFAFSGDGTEHVSLNVVTGEPEASQRVGFDAVRFSRR